jgi:acylphosphatase
VKRVRVIARGRVQGVFFRAACAEQARRLGLAGWVRNAADESVEAEFEGPDDAVEAIVAWCATGPPAAVVVGLERDDRPPSGGSGFRVIP